MSLSARILTALVLGLVGGALLAQVAAPFRDGALAVARPVGRLWLDALTMTVVPLVFGLLVTGVGAASRSAASGTVARTAVLWFALLLVGACAVGALAMTALLGILPVPHMALVAPAAGPAMPAATAADWVSGIIPTNPIKAAADTAMVPIVVFALLFGFAITRIDPARREAITTLFRATVDAMLVIVDWVLRLAPIGVFALAVVVGATLGIGAAGTLIHYALSVAAMCLLVAILAYGVAALFGGLSPLAFARAALPAQVVALSTQSSLASLPAMIEAGPALGVGRDVPAIVLPLAVSIFRAASAAANIAVAIYLAHVHGVALAPVTLVVGVFVAAAVSLAAVGLPAQVSFFATIGPVCVALGVPVTLLPLLLAVETVPDIFRTLGNVTTDLAVTCIVGRRAAAVEQA